MPAVAIYLALAGLAFALRANASLLTGPSFLGLGEVQGLAASLALGLFLAALTLWLTRVALRKSSQLRALHADLRPFTHGAGDFGLFAMACAGGIAEELFFRGALVPLVGVGVSSAPFGVLVGAVALVGVGYAGAQVFPMAMLPDAAAIDARRLGSSRVGVYTGVWTAGETLGLALGPGLFALLLAIGGYRSSTDGGAVQPDSALTAITLGFSVVPAALVVLSLIWLVRYALGADQVDERPAGASA